jgi:putative transcriptional regulator
MSKTYRSDALGSVHELMSDLFDAGAIDKQTMKDFDELCLTPIRPFSPRQIKKLRESAKVSQTVFARYLNVTPSLVSQWERGEKHPSGSSLKLLTLVAKNGLRWVA